MTNPRERKPVIGIVGGVGAGKSTAAAEFARLGCRLIDADAISHALLGEEGVRREVVASWGEAVLGPDGTVERKKLSAIVFADPSQLARLNSILHHRIRARIVEEIAQARAEPSVAAVVLDAAVLFEAGWDALCTHKVFVEAAGEQRAARVANRGWDRRHWEEREKTQISLDKKRVRCENYVDNSRSVSHLGEQIREVFNQIVRSAG
jgi:dephospho-CoA kinase